MKTQKFGINQRLEVNRYAIQAIGGVSVTIKGGEIKSDNHTAVYIYRSSGQKKDHATFTMEGGTITGGVYGLRHAHLNEINLSGGTITGGANQPMFIWHEK